MPVRTAAGQIALTRMFCAAYSFAAVFVRPSTACLLATYAPSVGAR